MLFLFLTILVLVLVNENHTGALTPVVPQLAGNLPVHQFLSRI